jgi:predicted small metal-binding protein
MKNLFFILIAIITFSCSSISFIPNINDCTIPERTQQETELINDLFKHAQTDIQNECYNEITDRLFMLVKDCQITYEYYLFVLQEIIINLDNDKDYDLADVNEHLIDYILYEGSEYETIYDTDDTAVINNILTDKITTN